MTGQTPISSHFSALADEVSQETLEKELIAFIQKAIKERSFQHNDSPAGRIKHTAEGPELVQWEISFIPGRAERWTLALLLNRDQPAVYELPVEGAMVAVTPVSMMNILFGPNAMGEDRGIVLTDHYNIYDGDRLINPDGLAEQPFPWPASCTVVSYQAMATEIIGVIDAFMEQMESLVAVSLPALDRPLKQKP